MLNDSKINTFLLLMYQIMRMERLIGSRTITDLDENNCFLHNKLVIYYRVILHIQIANSKAKIGTNGFQYLRNYNHSVKYNALSIMVYLFHYV